MLLLTSKVYTQTVKSRKEILHINFDGQDSAWHTASATVQRNSMPFGLVFEANVGSTWSEDNVGIDNIVMEPGACTAEGNIFFYLFKTDNKSMDPWKILSPLLQSATHKLKGCLKLSCDLLHNYISECDPALFFC